PETNLQVSATPLVFLLDETAGDIAPGALQAAFPQARVLGGTAYPPAASKQFVHFFSYAQAQRQGYLLPARVETRLPRLHQQLTLVTAPRTSTLPYDLNLRRTNAIAEDLHEHFMQEIHSNGGKALVLASNAQEAAWYYEALEKKMAARVAVFLPKPQPQERELAALYRRFEDHEKIVQRWHDLKDELALVILSESLREDLRTPQVQAVYLDRELRGYELLRALALTQMPGSGQKHFGLLVDYFGVSKFLDEELQRFAFQQTEPVLTPRFAENAFEELRLWRRELRAIFNAYPHEDNFEAWLFALEPAEPRRAFHRTWQGYAKALDQLLPSLHAEHGLLQEALWFDRVRQEAASFYFDKTLHEAQASAKVRRMLENAAHTYGARRVREAAGITSADFMSELEALSSRQAQVLRLQYALMEEVRQNVERDPVFYQALQQRVTKVTVQRQQKQIDDEAALLRLREEALRLRQGGLALDAEAQLSPEAQTYWRVLVRYLAPPESEHRRYEELAARLLAALEPDTKMVDWTLKEDWQREMRRKIKHLLREVNCPQDLLDPLTQAVMQLTKARFG
ncbi:MAG: type I restriction enzyme endonuclease domain-containing protein, partial [candidate division KSB1 bacterium]